jgi:hypothetical protein
MIPYPYGKVRAVTHYGIEGSDIDHAADAARRALAQIGAARRGAGRDPVPASARTP